MAARRREGVADNDDAIDGENAALATVVHVQERGREKDKGASIKDVRKNFRFLPVA